MHLEHPLPPLSSQQRIFVKAAGVLRRALLLLLVLLFWFLSAEGQTFNKIWDKTFGGTMNEEIGIMQHTSDGGYILGGYSYSGATGDKSQASNGGPDYWVVKVDSAGVLQWEKSFGGNDYDWLQSIQQTTDGGYILGGHSRSGASGDKTEANEGDFDYWVVKITSTGTKQWDKRFGGDERDDLFSVQQTSDGGYILGGHSKSCVSGQKTDPCHDLYDFWIVKLSSTGIKQWDKTFGGTDWDYLYSVQQTMDGGYILGGHARVGQWDDDYWIVKVDDAGAKEWDKTFGGTCVDRLYVVQQTPDSGYVLAGESCSDISDDKSQMSVSAMDYWIVKIDASGDKEWDKTFGGTNYSYLKCLAQTLDGGYIFGGNSNSAAVGDKSEPALGSDDYWVVKVDSMGNKEWDKTVGGNLSDQLHSVKQTPDGSYVLSGNSNSAPSAYKSQASKGYFDYWIIKLGVSTPVTDVHHTTPQLNVYPNPLMDGQLHITLSNAGKGSYLLAVCNSLGQQLAQHPLRHQTGTSQMTIAIPELAPGHYYLRLVDEDGRQVAARMILKQ